ncbi:hypothetical protein BC828DRAFT_407497 [Blastocladiella britannica]|nr:hypothetical protein BC828DRAFT_407497 [Blastocladiella britannica]
MLATQPTAPHSLDTTGRARTTSADMPATERAVHYAHVAGRDAATMVVPHKGSRYRANPFTSAPHCAEAVTALTLDLVMHTPATAPELMPAAARVATLSPGSTGPNLLATTLEAVTAAAAAAVTRAASDSHDDHQFAVGSPPTALMPDLYAGPAGVAFLLYKLHAADPGAQLAGGRSPLSVAADLIEHITPTIHSTSVETTGSSTSSGNGVGLIASPLGTLVTASLIAQHRGYGDQAADLASAALADAQQRAFDADTSSDVIYGRAGLAKALAMLAASEIGRNMTDAPSAAAAAMLPSVVEAIMVDGRRTATALGISNRTPVVWQCRGHVYLGAAHGMAGILTTLMGLPATVIAPYRDEIRAAIEFMASLDGFPVKMNVLQGGDIELVYGTRGPADEEVVVQWCHGVVGLGLMWLAAWRAFGTERSMAAAAAGHENGCLARATACGELAWQRGIVRKHVGLCHGVAGNAYLFLGLWSATGNAVWYQRACAFAIIAANWHDGTTAHPLSVWEGFGGLAWLLTDLVAVDKYIAHHSSGGASATGTSEGASRPWIGMPGVNDEVVGAAHGHEFGAAGIVGVPGTHHHRR